MSRNDDTIEPSRRHVPWSRPLADCPSPLRSSLSARVLAEVGIGDHYAQIPGPIGPLLVAWGPRRHHRDRARRRRDGLRARVLAPVRRAADAGRRHARAPARTRSDGGWRARMSMDPPVDLSHLTEFERSVLRKTMEIPRGEVRPYAWVAREIGRPRAVRAVGSALANNPIPFVIPCHRVVRTDGHIGEYGAGGPGRQARGAGGRRRRRGRARAAGQRRHPLLRVATRPRSSASRRAGTLGESRRST